MGSANSRQSRDSALTKKEMERMQRRSGSRCASTPSNRQSKSDPADDKEPKARLYVTALRYLVIYFPAFPARNRHENLNKGVPRSCAAHRLAALANPAQREPTPIKPSDLFACFAVEVSQPFHNPSCPCRFARLANGTGKVAIADMLQLPELSGNVLMEPILRLFDGDRDGYLTEAEVCRAVQKLGELQQAGADPCQGKTPRACLTLCTTSEANTLPVPETGSSCFTQAKLIGRLKGCRRSQMHIHA